MSVVIAILLFLILLSIAPDLVAWLFDVVISFVVLAVWFLLIGGGLLLLTKIL